ncbi:hypothetical protein N7535_003981 [Penicillium sp. DV-2018c]|nr:hypothetical protein N7461_000316 [Penicillium sp. DV-2018c]KAJ5577055.1 hypothetical protein N7535_003981 [Penicillium sp. DV-2018c]
MVTWLGRTLTGRWLGRVLVGCTAPLQADGPGGRVAFRQERHLFKCQNSTTITDIIDSYTARLRPSAKGQDGIVFSRVFQGSANA